VGEVTFSRYLGNLGVPPLQVSDAIDASAPSLYEEHKIPASWITAAWRNLGGLLARGRKLAARKQ
jgi:hypothetical protein